MLVAALFTAEYVAVQAFSPQVNIARFRQQGFLVTCRLLLGCSEELGVFKP